MEIVKGIGGLMKAAAPIARELFISYMQKPSNISNAAWMSGELLNRGLGLDKDQAMRFSDDVIRAVGNFSSNMKSIEQANANGRRDDQWLTKQLDSDPNWDVQSKGEYLAQINSTLDVGNRAFRTAVEESKMIDLNEENLELLRQAAQAGVPARTYAQADIGMLSKSIVEQSRAMSANAMLMDPKMLDEMMPQSIDDKPPIKESFLTSAIGSEIDRGVKMAAAAALKTVVTKSKFLSKVLPSNSIANIACVGVEGVKTAAKVASGKMKPADALAHMGKTALSVAADFVISKVPAAVVAPIPVIGPPLSIAVSTFLAPAIGGTIKNTVSSFVGALNPFAKKVPIPEPPVTVPRQTENGFFARVLSKLFA